MAGTLKIKKLTFTAGLRAGSPPLEIKPDATVLFVGPNNSGKSLALREIENWCFNQNTPTKVISQVEIDFPTGVRAAERLVRAMKVSPPPENVEDATSVWMGQHSFSERGVRRFQVSLTQLRDVVRNRDLNQLREWLTASYTIRLDGRTRFSLSDPKPTGDLLQPPQNHLAALFTDKDSREKVRHLTEEAFGSHFTIDPTAMTTFRIRLSSRAPIDNEDQSLDQRGRDFHSNAPLINEFSDGVLAFVGLISAVMSLPHKIILIDEPEAFLHPPLARRLGQNLSKLTQEREATLVSSTHSSEFLMGCLESTPNTVVVRLTYQGGIATARTLTAPQVKEMTKDPLLRSTGVLRGLFHKAVVVTEADADRAFYDEINRRLNNSAKGIDDALFINGQNMHTVNRLVKPLREIGIPTAAIVDLDFIRQRGSNWRNLIRACNIPDAVNTQIKSERDYLCLQFNTLQSASGEDELKKKGIRALNITDRTRARIFINELSKYGLFVVPHGELEKWLPSLGVSGHTPDWLIDVFSKIGDDETSTSYLRPSNRDVWKFLNDVSKWISNPQRLGVN